VPHRLDDLLVEWRGERETEKKGERGRREEEKRQDISE